MTPDTDTLTSWFRYFNMAYFGGRLPEPLIVTTDSRTILGQFLCRMKRRLRLTGFKRVPVDLMIKISTYYDIAERDYKNTLLHEMIHLSIACGGHCDTLPHGPLFRAEMARLNTTYGWDIKVRTSTRKWPVAKSAKKKRVYLVLVMAMNDGKKFISVVNPAYAKPIDRLAGSLEYVDSRAWYTSEDDYFAHFPKVRTLRGRDLSGEELDRLLPLLTPDESAVEAAG